MYRLGKVLYLNRGKIYTAACDAIPPDCISCSFERDHVVARERRPHCARLYSH